MSDCAMVLCGVVVHCFLYICLLTKFLSYGETADERFIRLLGQILHMLCLFTVTEYRMKKYRLGNLQVPVGLLPNGVREYIVNQMAGVDTEGNVRRAVDRETGEQYIIITLTASLATFHDIENGFLTSDLWDYETLHDEGRRGFSHRRFVILQSWKGAVRGRNSNPSYDYVSSQGGSSRSGSSRGGSSRGGSSRGGPVV